MRTIKMTKAIVRCALREVLSGAGLTMSQKRCVYSNVFNKVAYSEWDRKQSIDYAKQAVESGCIKYI
jgi:hypothetical protein